MICEKCGKEFLEDWRKYPEGEARFCSKACSNSRSWSEEDKKIRSDKLKKHPDNFCEVCGKKISHKNNQKICLECKPRFKKYDNNYYYLKDFRKRLKEKAVDYKGGKCIICGYNKCVSALDFHHVDANSKDFNVSSNTNRKWEILKEELDKCVLVCSNCHREIHANLILLEEYI